MVFCKRGIKKLAVFAISYIKMIYVARINEGNIIIGNL